MCLASGGYALIQVRIDGLDQLIITLCNSRSLSSEYQLEKGHEHPDGYNREKDATQYKECI